jgi:GDPmannose 4,6-dehydratase
MVELYRRAHGLFACNGIMFNHESPRRSSEFFSRRLTEGAVRIKTGKADRLPLGNLHPRRDWGFAGDYMAAAWAMLQRPAPEDFVIATGVRHTVQDFVTTVFAALGLDGQRFVAPDPSLARSDDPDSPPADTTKAEAVLGWRPTVEFDRLVKMLVEAELRRAGVS